MPGERPLLCLVGDRRLREDLSLPEVFARAAGAGIPLLQVREKGLDDRALYDLVRETVAAVAGIGATVLVNSRFDISLAAGAGGVHLPESGLPPEVVRRHVPPGFLVGASAHSLGTALAADRGGADFIVFGPVFDTPAKRPYGPPQGVERLAEVCREVGRPVLAVGGIDEQRVEEVLAAGAAGVAVIRAIYAAADPAAAAAGLLRRLERKGA